MRFTCPHCSANLSASEEDARHRPIRCPGCRTIFHPGGTSGSTASQPKAPNTPPAGVNAGKSLNSLFPGNAHKMGWLLYGSITTYLIGIIWPLMTIEKKILGFPFKGDTISLLGGIVKLFFNGDLLLFLILFTFSIAFPVGKLIVLFRLWHHPYQKERCGELAHRLAVFGKWSMLDVIVVGLLVVVVKIEGMVSVKVHAGVTFFAASVILTMITTAWIGKMLATRGT